jgi:hypothetical protein
MQVKFRADNDAVVGALHLPTSAGAVVTVAGVGDSRTEALARAALLAERIAQDPVLSAVLPPQVLASIRAAKGIAAGASQGKRALSVLARRLRGPKQKLARTLARDYAERRPVQVPRAKEQTPEAESTEAETDQTQTTEEEHVDASATE